MKIISSLATLILLAVSSIAAQAAFAQTYVSAAITWPGNKAQFFLSDGTYVRYDVKADTADEGYPKPVNNKTWPGMGAYGKQIAAAVRGGDPNKAFFFLTDGSYLRYDVKDDRVDEGYPKPITNKTWPGMGKYATKIISAINWPGDKVQFFLSDGTYIRYDLKADSVEEGYPKAINNSTWPGLAQYSSKLAGAINWNGSKAYFFLEDGRYLRYDIKDDRVDEGYPKATDEKTWPGLYGYFRRR